VSRFTQGDDGAYYNAPNLKDPIRWIISRGGGLKWTYQHYDLQTGQYRLLLQGDTVPSSPCLTVLAGIQDLVLETMPDILLFPGDWQADFCNTPGVRNWTDVDAPEAQELIGHRLIDFTEDGRGCYFDLAGYIHLIDLEIGNAHGGFEYDIYVRMPSSSKSARSAH